MSRTYSSVEELRDELQSQIADIGSELRSIRKSLAKRAPQPRQSDLYEGMTDMFEDMLDRIADVLPDMRNVRKRARSAGRTLQEHPGTTATSALVGVAVLGILAALLLRR
jgi:gamma-glutamyl:cysteine ligase YbdK (ATP-grasp superfamily)